MRGHDLFRYGAAVAAGLCYLTILLGGNVMASDSGLACPDWPTCHGMLVPPLAGPTGVEWAHRLSALVLSVAILALTSLALLFERTRPVLLRLTLASLGTVVGQALLGGVVVTSDLAVGLVLFHLGLATALFGILLLLVLLANLREIPRRWIDWAHRAADESVALDARPEAHRAPAPTGGVGAAPVSPSGL